MTFSFEISLSVLDDLGRKLYRSFETVLGEAISNAWDADADNVWIYIDRTYGNFVIKDDGDGMTADDFQNKFLRIGYSKRRDGITHSKKGRPFIGRKGIGKLAPLSCADSVSIMTKTASSPYIDGLIDNRELDKAIVKDMTPQEYPLPRVNAGDFKKYTGGHSKGTIIYFYNMKEGIKSSLDHVRKTIALYFRFSLMDSNFKVFVDDVQVTLDDLKDLAEKTEFLWLVNGLKDPWTEKMLLFDRKNEPANSNIIEPPRKMSVEGPYVGFVATVRKPADLKVLGTDEKIGLDLFVNGRLRERDIVRHIPTAKIPESYLYGQIHFNDLDDGTGKDRFSTSREGIVANDEKFEALLVDLKGVISKVISDWDELRGDHHRDGDPDNPRISRKERKADELYNAVSEEYSLSPDPYKPEVKAKIDGWLNELSRDARFNFPSYADCFLSENLIRKHIEDKKIPLSPEAEKEIGEYVAKEKERKEKVNLSIEIRANSNKLTYLSMDGLAYLVENKKRTPDEAGLSRDAEAYKPLRDAVMHTALLTEEAQSRLTTVYDNIRGRVRSLLSQ